LRRSLTLAAWLIPFALAVLAVATHRQTVNAWEWYAWAARRWWGRDSIYLTTGIDGFLYFPQATLIFSPFSAMGPLGDAAWRAFGWALYAHAMFRLVGRERFWLASLLAVGPGIASLAIGQGNLHIAGLMGEAVASLTANSWWGATGWLMLGLGLKPHVIVLVLLAWALYPPLRWRILLGLVLLALFPFLFGSPSYVLAQYRGFWNKFQLADAPGADRMFEDFRGLVSKLGWLMPHRIYFWVRAAFAGIALALSWQARRRCPEPIATMLVYAFAAAYLMLFNPRTQPGSYVILTPATVWFGLRFLEERRRGLFVLVLVSLAIFCFNNHMTSTELWLKPLDCLVLASALAFHFIFRQRVRPA
jgi:hypothetical protein